MFNVFIQIVYIIWVGGTFKHSKIKMEKDVKMYSEGTLSGSFSQTSSVFFPSETGVTSILCNFPEILNVRPGTYVYLLAPL